MITGAANVLDSSQQLVSLGIGGVLISLVGYSVWKLIGGWMDYANTEKAASLESKERAGILQTQLYQEISKRVALEVEVKYLMHEIEELKAEAIELKNRILHLENNR